MHIFYWVCLLEVLQTSAKQFSKDILGEKEGSAKLIDEASAREDCVKFNLTKEGINDVLLKDMIDKATEDLCNLYGLPRVSRDVGLSAASAAVSAAVAIGATAVTGVIAVVAVVTLTGVIVVGVVFYNKISAAEEKVVEIEKHHNKAENSSVSLHEFDTRKAVVEAWTSFLEDVLDDGKTVGVSALEFLPPVIWNSLGLDRHKDQEELHNMVHRAHHCSGSTIVFTVCHTKYGNVSSGALYEVGHIGAFTNEGRIFRYKNGTSHVHVSNSGELRFIDKQHCVKKNSVFHCRFEKATLLKDEKFNYISIPSDKDNFVFSRSLGKHYLLASKLKTFIVKHSNGSLEVKKFPKSGVMMIGVEQGAVLEIGDVKIRGRLARRVSVHLNPSEIADVDLQDLKIMREENQVGEKLILELEELVNASLLEQVLHWIKNNWIYIAWVAGGLLSSLFLIGFIVFAIVICQGCAPTIQCLRCCCSKKKDKKKVRKGSDMMLKEFV